MKGLRDSRLLAVTPAMVYATPTVSPFISLSHRFLYHQDGSAVTVLLALLANLALVWLFFTAILSLADRILWVAVFFWTVFLGSLPLIALRDWSSLMYQGLPSSVHRGAMASFLAFVGFVLAAWKPVLRPHLPVILSRLKALTGFASLGWLVTVLQLVSYVAAARHLDAQPNLHRRGQTAATGPRVIWVIMDELAYDAVFEHRFPGLLLPNLDAMASQSTKFAAAASPGLSTEEVIPELIMGQSVSRVALGAGGTFDYLVPARGSWQELQPSETVFADALRNGYSTAVAGWFNPYCRLLGPVLDRCFWISRTSSATPDFDARASFLHNLAGPAMHAWEDVHLGSAFTADADRHEAALHIVDLRSILGAADATLADSEATFVLIHLPVPHPGGIYDRNRGVLSSEGGFSYVDNLALADQVLGHLRDVLIRSGTWDGSAVVLMGDHSWRTTMRWIPTRSWTNEDQMASRGGGFDARPLYMVKLPEQQTAATVSQSYQTVRTRALLDEIMLGQVRTPADLQRWAERR